MRRKPSILSSWPRVCVTAVVGCALAARAVTVAELQVEMAGKSRSIVIDVRGSDLFARGHIPGAINVPASLCPRKNLPPLGKVVVCGGGLGRDATDAAAAALAAKPGLSVEILEGGFAAWESAHAPSTKPMGLRPESLNYIAYADLKAAKAGEVVLVDLRDRDPAPSRAGNELAGPSLTDLAAEFPGMRVARSAVDALAPPRESLSASGVPPLMVLIDSGNGKAEAAARALKAGGASRYVILAGGEAVIARKGRPGLERAGSTIHPPKQSPVSGGGR